MSVALPEQLNFERSMPLSGGSRQQMGIALPITDAGSYLLGSTFVINIPCCSDNTVFDPCNSFLFFNVAIQCGWNRGPHVGPQHKFNHKKIGRTSCRKSR